MSHRHQEACEIIWAELVTIKEIVNKCCPYVDEAFEYSLFVDRLEQILTLTESRIQDDLEAMQRSVSASGSSFIPV